MGVDIGAIFAAVPSPFMLIDRDLRIVWANDAYLAITGRDAETVIGRILAEEFPAEPDSVSEQMLQASFTRVFETGETDHLPLIPYPITGADGKIEQRYWSATHTPILGPGGRVDYLLQNTNDVTELYLQTPGADGDGGAAMLDDAEPDQVGVAYRAEQVARQNLELGTATRFFETVFDQAPSFIAILSGPDHVFQLANKSYAQLVGGRRLIGLTLREALPELEGQGFIELLEQVYETGKPVTIYGAEAQVRLDLDQPPRTIFADFVYQPLTGSNGESVGILVQGHEVTAQKLAEQDLREAEERFRSMAQLMPAHVWTAQANGELDWLSDQIYSYSGYADGTLYGADWVKVVHPDDLDRVAAVWVNAIESGTPYETEFRIRRKDGSYRWHLVRATPVTDSSGVVVRWIGTNTDIEDRKATEAALADLNATLEERVEQRNRELEELHATLRQSQKMEAIGTLAGGVAHDFNNLLQAITGSLQLAQREIAPDGPTAQRLAMAMQAVDRGATLAAQLLAFGRRQPLEPKPVNLGRLLAEMDTILGSAVGEGIDIDTHVADGLWATLIDPTNVENALLNLAVNARDAMEGRGRLELRVENAVLDADYARGQTEVVPGEYVRLSVSDSGSGMAPEVVEKIFEPFFTTKPEGKGTGLGMAMVYGFVKQSGGHVVIDSAPGHGTTVRIYLPRSLRAEEIIAPQPEGAAPGGHETVLLVEDDEDVRRTTAAVIADLGYTVIEADDADAGMRILEGDAPIDLLLTDVLMPGKLTSREMAGRGQLLRPGIAVLFASGFSRDAIVHDGRLDDGIQLLRKPYGRDVLARKMREVLDRARDSARAVAPAPVAPVAVAPTGPVPLRILVCEDDAFIRLDLAEMLESSGAEVLEAGSGQEALALLGNTAVDLLLVDVGLPDRSGLEVARDAVVLLPDLAVIFATGRDEVPGSETLPNASLLTKPFSQEALLRAVANQTGRAIAAQ